MKKQRRAMSGQKLKNLEAKILREAEEIETGKRGMKGMVDLKESLNLDLNLDLKMISIRLPSETLEALKILANREGLKYQPYIRSLLVRHVRERIK